MASRDEAKGKAAAAALRAGSVKSIEAVRFDVTRPEDHAEIVKHLASRYGKLDILVNNAGVMLDQGEFGAPDGFNTTATGEAGHSSADLRDELLRRGGAYAGPAAADPQGAGRPHR